MQKLANNSIGIEAGRNTLLDQYHSPGIARLFFHGKITACLFPKFFLTKAHRPLSSHGAPFTAFLTVSHATILCGDSSNGPPRSHRPQDSHGRPTNAVLDEADAYSIEEFCRQAPHQRPAFYKHPDLMPDRFYVASRRLISREAAARWRAEREAAERCNPKPCIKPVRARPMPPGRSRTHARRQAASSKKGNQNE